MEPSRRDTAADARPGRAGAHARPARPPWLLDHAPHAPFMEPRTARPPGLMPLSEGALVTADPDFAAQMALREALLAGRREVVLGCPAEGRAPADELLAHVAGAAPRAAGFGCEGDLWHRPDGAALRIDRADPLASLGRMVAEDFCLLLPDAASGEYRLVAAVLCFPSRWLLSEKLGRPLTAIHDPVPDYDATLARRVNRVFETLREGRALWRVNWLVHATPELHLPLGLSDKLVAEADPREGLYLRTERQTLTRLPETGAVAFGIKTSVCPLEALTPEQAGALARALAALDPEVVAYRSGAAAHALAIDRLASLAAG
jgi:hypothetical protein